MSSRSSPTTRSTISVDAVLAALLFLATLAVFYIVVRNEFVMWDDDIAITGNPHIRELSASSLEWMFTDYSQTLRYVPLNWLNWALMFHVFVLQAYWFHLEALLMHAINAVLVFYVIRALLRRGAVGPATRSGDRHTTLSVSAALGALMWSVHPLRAEVVAWATQGRFAQSLMFLLIGVLAYLTAVDAAPRTRRRAFFYVVSVAASAVSALSYPIGTTLVLVLLALDAYPLRRFASPSWERARRLLWEKVPFALVPIVVWMVTLWARFHAPGQWTPPPSLADLPVLDRVMQSFYICAYYVIRPWYPFHLTPVYTTLIDFDPTAPIFLASAAFVVLVTVGSVLAWRRYPALTIVWACHLVLLAPVLGLFDKPHYSSDRYAYLEGILWSVLLSAGLFLIGKRTARGFRLACASVAVVSVAFSVLSYRQTLIWKDSVTLYRYMIATLGAADARADLQQRLGLAYLARGQDGDERAALEQLLAFPPPADTMLSAGWIFLDRKRPDEASAVFRRALSMPSTPGVDDPLQSRLRNGLAVALVRSGRLAEGEVELMEAVRLDPRNLEALSNLGQALHALGRYDRAVEVLTELVRLSPGERKPRELLDKALAARDRR